jgi:adenosylcobinamide amidohydrolase
VLGPRPRLLGPDPAPDVRACLVWRLPPGWRAISTALTGGGIGPVRWIIDAEVSDGYARLDPDRHVAEISAALGLEGPGVGMLTAAPVRDWTRGEDGGVVVDGTIGVTRPTWAADVEDAHGRWCPDTVNLVAAVPAPLSDAALVNVVVTVTEAKSQALLERGVPGTGTASDAVCVVCPDADEDGSDSQAFGGPRSVWGARVARATHRAVLDGLARP